MGNCVSSTPPPEPAIFPVFSYPVGSPQAIAQAQEQQKARNTAAFTNPEGQYPYDISEQSQYSGPYGGPIVSYGGLNSQGSEGGYPVAHHLNSQDGLNMNAADGSMLQLPSISEGQETMKSGDGTGNTPATTTRGSSCLDSPDGRRDHSDSDHSSDSESDISRSVSSRSRSHSEISSLASLSRQSSVASIQEKVSTSNRINGSGSLTQSGRGSGGRRSVAVDKMKMDAMFDTWFEG